MKESNRNIIIIASMLVFVALFVTTDALVHHLVGFFTGDFLTVTAISATLAAAVATIFARKQRLTMALITTTIPVCVFFTIFYIVDLQSLNSGSCLYAITPTPLASISVIVAFIKHLIFATFTGLLGAGLGTVIHRMEIRRRKA